MAHTVTLGTYCVAEWQGVLNETQNSSLLHPSSEQGQGAADGGQGVTFGRERLICRLEHSSV